jgi:hypothetical protein
MVEMTFGGEEKRYKYLPSLNNLKSRGSATTARQLKK